MWQQPIQLKNDQPWPQSADTKPGDRPADVAIPQRARKGYRGFFATPNDIALTVMRVMLGVVMFPHGAQKVFGWFGGFGWTGTMGFFTGQLGVPGPLAVVAILGEFLGALGLIFGFLTRLSALGIALIMIGAIVMVHLPNGFLMNWSGTKAGEGYEFHLLALAMAVALLLRGGGALSVDRAISKER